jgi:hypothetical protein
LYPCLTSGQLRGQRLDLRCPLLRARHQRHTSMPLSGSSSRYAKLGPTPRRRVGFPSSRGCRESSVALFRNESEEEEAARATEKAAK